MGRSSLNVSLKAHTPDPERMVALAARTCYSASTIDDLDERISKKDQASFIRMLLSSGHLSTIEHVSFTFAVEGVSRSLLAQITRHRIASFSVQSQRYVSKRSKKGEVFSFIIPPAIQALGAEYIEKYESQMLQMQKWYDEWQGALGGGESSNEDARFVLPNAAETRFIFTMNARELLHFFSLRCCYRAQWEIRELAWEMLRLLSQAAPVLFESAGPACLRGTCPEGAKSCGRNPEVKARAESVACKSENR